MKKLCFMLCLLAIPMLSLAGKKEKIIKITVQPAEASIYVNNTFMGRGYAEFTRPEKKSGVAIIRCELNEYITVNSKFLEVIGAAVCRLPCSRMASIVPLQHPV